MSQPCTCRDATCDICIRRQKKAARELAALTEIAKRARQLGRTFTPEDAMALMKKAKDEEE